MLSKITIRRYKDNKCDLYDNDIVVWEGSLNQIKIIRKLVRGQLIELEDDPLTMPIFLHFGDNLSIRLKDIWSIDFNLGNE